MDFGSASSMESQQQQQQQANSNVNLTSFSSMDQLLPIDSNVLNKNHPTEKKRKFIPSEELDTPTVFTIHHNKQYYNKRCGGEPRRYTLEEFMRRQDQEQELLARFKYRVTATRLGVAEALGIDPAYDRIEQDTIYHNSKRPPCCSNVYTTLPYSSASIPDVSIYPSDVRGTLEAHENEFKYFLNCSSSGGISDPPFQVLYENVKIAFYQMGDDKAAVSFLHLNLSEPVTVGTEMTKDIQFRFMVQQQQQTLERRKILPHDDSDNNPCDEKEQRKSTNEVLRTFIVKVKCLMKLRYALQILKVKRELGFYGEMPLKEHFILSSVFVFLLPCLLQLEHRPFVVVKLSDIEIVNLMQVGSGQETTINMTIVFKDFKRDVLQINSIPSTKLERIKCDLHLQGVKYYDNQLNPDWGSILKGITEDPMTFIQNGGWKFLNSGKSPPIYTPRVETWFADDSEYYSDGDSDNEYALHFKRKKDRNKVLVSNKADYTSKQMDKDGDV